MKRLFILSILLLPLSAMPQEAQMKAADPVENSEKLFITSPVNGQVFMREAIVQGQAGNNILSVKVINLTGGTTNGIDVRDGKWVVRVPLAIARTNQLLVKGIIGKMEQTIPSPVRKIWVVSRLDFSRAGKIFMVVIWTLIIALNVFAFMNIFKIDKEKIVEPLEIDTMDD